MVDSGVVRAVDPDEPVSETERDQLLHRAAARLFQAWKAQRSIEIAPELEAFLRGLIFARVLRVRRAFGHKALGIDADDVAQRVFLKLTERPLSVENVEQPLARLVAWTNVTTRNHLTDLMKRRTEVLESSNDRRSGVGLTELARNRQTSVEQRLDAAQNLKRAVATIEQHYPAGSALLALLMQAPHATSGELARALGTSSANVDQMRSRIRKLLRHHLADALLSGGELS